MHRNSASNKLIYQNIFDSCQPPRLSLLFSDLVDVMDIAMWELDLEYRVVAYNQKARKIYGADVAGKYCYAAAAKRDDICPDCPAKKVYDGHDSGRSTHARKDVHGKQIYIDHIATPIRDASGRLTGVLVLIIDITQHKRMEQELRLHRNQLENIVQERTKALRLSQEKYRNLYEEAKRAEQVYRSLLNSSADAIAICNLNLETLYVSPTFSRIFGWTFTELEGRKIPFVPESEKRVHESVLADVVEKGIPCHGFETTRLTKNGKVLDVSISASRYKDHRNKPAGILIILRDISDRKKLEAQLKHSERMEAIGTLAGGIAHDFNNLMMGILGNVSMILLNTEPDDPHFKRLRQVEDLIESGSKLTSQLLGFARKGKYKLQPLVLNDVIRNTIETFARARKDIRVEMDLDEQLLPVMADRTQMEQILFNLCVNAADAMPEGGRLELKTRNIELGNIAMNGQNDQLHRGYVLLQVSDEGIGMDKQTLEHIFEPFYTTKGIGKGTGLGLASVYGIVKGHEGQIEVKSEPGKGATFSVHLPATSQRASCGQTSNKAIAQGRGNVLLVDDEPIVLDVAGDMLSRLGYGVIKAESGKKAVEIYADQYPIIDLVIVDMIMPEMNGRDTIQAIFRINPEAKILLSSGYSLDRLAKEIVSCGCAGFVQKPFNLKILSDKIVMILGDRNETG